jgi:multidrug efflux pump
MTSFQLPSDATTERTLDVVKVFEKHVASRPGIDANQSILGFSFSGAGTKYGNGLYDVKRLVAKEWRDSGRRAKPGAVAMSGITEGTVFSLMHRRLMNSAPLLALRYACRIVQTKAKTLYVMRKIPC